MSLLIYLLAVSGATQIIVFGRIFERIRGDSKFLKCPQCVGFWVGLIFAVFSKYSLLFNYSQSFYDIFILSCIGSLVSYVTYVIFGDDGININIRRSEDEQSMDQ